MHLEALSPEFAVEMFRNLLWAEATAIGILKSLVNVPSATDVKDGGIDAEIKAVAFAAGQGIIKKGLTRYQIKTGNFSLKNDSQIREILFNDAGKLKPRVKSCLSHTSGQIERARSRDFCRQGSQIGGRPAAKTTTPRGVLIRRNDLTVTTDSPIHAEPRHNDELP